MGRPARISIGIKIGHRMYEDVLTVSVGFDGVATNENIADGLEMLAKAIREQMATMKAPREGAAP